MEYSRAAFAQLFLRAAQDAAAAAASARGHREQEAILLLSVSYSALWAECRFSVLQNAQVPGMGRTKRSKNQKTSQKQPSAAAAAAASAAKEKQPSAAAAAAASAAKDPRFCIGDRIGVTSIDRGPVGVYRWAKIVKAYQGGGALHFHIEWQDDYTLYKVANIEQCLTEKEMRDMEARKAKRPRDKKNAQSSSKKSKSTNDTGPMHPHQTWPCSQPMMDAYGKKEQLLATQEMQEFGLKALKQTQREIATAQKKKDAAAVAAHVERQQETKEKLARLMIAEGHYENWKADNHTVVAFLESLVMNEATRPTVQQAAVVVRADYEAQKTECDAANVPGQHAWCVPDRPEGSPLQTLVQLWRGAGMSSSSVLSISSRSPTRLLIQSSWSPELAPAAAAGVPRLSAACANALAIASCCRVRFFGPIVFNFAASSLMCTVVPSAISIHPSPSSSLLSLSLSSEPCPTATR